MRRLWVVPAAMAILAGIAMPAQAHTSLRSSSPASGATVPSPAQIVLTYADPVIVPRVIVTDTAGGHHETGPAHAVDAQVTQRVGGPLTPGVYTVGWRVVASDGHPVSGQYRFTVRGTAASARTTATPPASGSSGPGSAAPGAAVSPTPPAGSRSPGAGGPGAWLWTGLILGLVAVCGTAITLAVRHLR
jgi:methionine-rich copper-binding protein CopC